MWNRYLYYLIQFKEIVVFSMAVLVAATLVLFLLLKRFGFGKRKNLAAVTLFFNIRPRHMLYLGANFLLLCFVPAVLLFSKQMQISYLCYLLALSLIAGLSIRKVLELVRLAAGSILIYTAFFIVDMLKSYTFNMVFDVRIVIIGVMLCVFVLFFDFYSFLNSIRCIARDIPREEEIVLEEMEVGELDD